MYLTDEVINLLGNQSALVVELINKINDQKEKLEANNLKMALQVNKIQRLEKNINEQDEQNKKLKNENEKLKKIIAPPINPEELKG